MATCVINVEDDQGSPLLQVSTKELAGPVTVWDRQHWGTEGPSPKILICGLSLDEAERIGLALIRCVAGHRAYLDNYEFWHGDKGPELAKANAATDPEEEPWDPDTNRAH
jgi:hypothetical protein